MEHAPSPTADNGRGPGGRFAPGNKLAKGNPFAKQTQQLRVALYEAVTAKDLKAIVKSLIEQAKKGNVPAAKEVLERVLGKPEAADFVERLEQLEEHIEQLAKQNPSHSSWR